MTSTSFRFQGILYALVIIICWATMLMFLLNYQINFLNPLFILFVLVQTHLYTGLFITAHDAIHGVVAPQSPRLNKAIGFFCATLFAFNYYPKLYKKHHLHHQHSVSEEDPDYSEGGFWKWWLKFVLEYVTIWQIVLMAITYNILKLYFPIQNIILFWELPAILSTFQLFYFGTYLPHRGEHEKDDIYKARSQKLDHLTAFFTCYFFGYHHEHHAYPYLPWWQLPKAKEMED